jgi:hypothetical protein
MKLTNIRTYCQFSQYGEVKSIVFYGNRFMAMNSIRFGYGVKSFTVLKEYKTDGYLPEGQHTVLSMPFPTFAD